MDSAVANADMKDAKDVQEAIAQVKSWPRSLRWIRRSPITRRTCWSASTTTTRRSMRPPTIRRSAFRSVKRKNGMPVGVTLIGKPGSEAKLLSYAYALEQATKLRVNPDLSKLGK